MGRDRKGSEGIYNVKIICYNNIMLSRVSQMGRNGKGWEGMGRDGNEWQGMGRDNCYIILVENE